MAAAAAVWAKDWSLRARNANNTEAITLVFTIDAEDLENMLRITVDVEAFSLKEVKDTAKS